MQTEYEAPSRKTQGPIDPDRFGLIELAELFARQGKRIAAFTLAVGVVAAIVSLLLPPWYQAETTIFAPEEVTESRRVLSTLRSLSIPGLRQKVGVQSPETFLAILESRRLREPVIERFGLVKVYRAKKLEDCLKIFDKRVTAVIENTGIIRVSVQDRDKTRAAEIANAAVEELDKINVEVRIYKARRARQFLETQLAEVRGRLAAAEDSLSRFQRENLAVSIDEQAKVAVEAVAKLQAQVIELRIKRGILESYASESNPELTSLTRELGQVEGQLRDLEVGTEEQFSISRLPEVAIRLAQHLREMKVAEALLTLLTQDYEEARLEEAKETPVVQVLDRAVPPERRSWPRRSLFVLASMAITLLLSIAFVVASDRYRALATESEQRRWSMIASRVASWLRLRGRAS
jgi:uncharacterized protein involved in exopolysaccharide biosynthesis